MKQSLILLLGVCFLIPSLTFAAIPKVYTNDNFQSSTHEPPATFASDGAGGFYGTTISGRTFTQTKVSVATGIRLQKFSIDEAYFYMSDKGEIWAETDLGALSKYLYM
jgi:hypothetical protein